MYPKGPISKGQPKVHSDLGSTIYPAQPIMAQVTAPPSIPVDPSSTPSRPQNARPQPGDGAYLTTPRARGMRGGHRGRGRGAPRQNGEGSVSGASSRVNTRPSSPHTGENGPIHSAQPREVVDGTVGGDANGRNAPNGESRARGRGRGGHRSGRSIGGVSRQEGSQKGNIDISDAQPTLDPAAPIFSPQLPPHLADQHASHNHHHLHDNHTHSHTDTNPNLLPQPKNSRSKPKPKPKSAQPASPPQPISSRKAAFISGTKLTSSTSPSSDDERLIKGKKVVEAEKVKEKEKDDLVSRLTRGLKTRPFLECPIVGSPSFTLTRQILIFA
jgi:transcriptional repressor NF-X1